MDRELRRQSVQWCYEHLGWSFLPLAGKRPVEEGWTTRSRESLDQALRWADAGNVGVRTGAASGGLVVVDVDAGGDAQVLELPATVTNLTGSGGKHFYFHCAELIGCSVGKLGPHIDVRGEGGQVVFAGSIHPETKAAYQWMEGHEPWSMDLADLPPAIIQRLNSAHPAPARPMRRKRVPGSAPLGSNHLARFILRSETEAVAKAVEGERNNRLNSAAFCLGRLIGGGYLDLSTVEDELRRAAEQAGLEPAETDRTIASGLEAGIREPRRLDDEHAAREKHTSHRGTATAEPDPAGSIPLGSRDPATGRLVLSPRRTLPTARAFVEQFHTHADGKTIHSYAGLILAWLNNRYVEIEEEALRHQLQPWLHDALRYVVSKQTGEPELVDFESNPGTINSALESIRSFVHLAVSVSMPSWLEGYSAPCDACEVLPCRTRNLHIPSGSILPATPALFTGNALDFDHDPDAPAPDAWLSFLDRLWSDDREQIETLQEWFGYCLTADTSQQKMLLLVGPKRSGKGTIGRVLTRLVGTSNVVGPTIASLAGSFGLQPLIGKSLAIVSDARFSGENIGVVIERLLCISGEDTLTVDRKFLASITMKLPTRFMLLTNELPRMTDASGALAGRFIILRLVESFYGREDTALTAKLLSELPGILLWALEGWKRLHARGRFLQPASVSDAVQDMEDLASPVAAFVRDCCHAGTGQRVWVDDLYAAWKRWCEQEGQSVATTKQTFGRDLAAAVAGVTRRRGAGDVPFYDGIALKEVGP